VIDRVHPSPIRSRHIGRAPRQSIPAETRARNRRRELLREARRLRATRNERIFGCFVRGMPHGAIARLENCSAPAVRKLIARELAGRRVDPAGDFAKLQIARLNDALMAANSKMLEGDMAALDRVVKVVAELDRYHGIAQALERRESAARPLALAGPAQPRLPAPPAPERAAEAAGEGRIRIASL
jgi:hypothetical protein